jgi:hypothetical protein
VNEKLIIKVLTLVGLLAGLLGAVRLFNSIRPAPVNIKSTDGGEKVSLEVILDERLSRSGIKLMFWGFLAQFSAVFCQLFYY